MSTLKIRINKYLDIAASNPPEVYATITLLSADSTNQPSLNYSRECLIPISHRPEDNKAIKLPPGHYYVKAVLPSGEVLADDVVVSTGETKEFVLRAEDSPQSWLSWQHLVGNVAFEPAKPPATETDQQRFRKARSRRRRPPPNEVNLASPITWLSHLPPELDQNGSGGSWSLLKELQNATPNEIFAKLDPDRNGVPINAWRRDDKHAVFRFTLAQINETRREPGEAGMGGFLLIKRRRSVELVRLPMPWQVVLLKHEAILEIALQEPSRRSDFCSSLSVMDEKLGILIGYLSAGSLPAARQMSDQAENLLYQKMENPFAAAAGGYALVGSAQKASVTKWHKWVRKLMTNFPSIPDGAIQWGHLMLQMNRNESDLRKAGEAFKLGYRRGLPFYSIGMRWLLEGLEWIATTDNEAKAILNDVRQVAWRVAYQQVFTIIRLGADRNV
jgi:hypothetical protein